MLRNGYECHLTFLPSLIAVSGLGGHAFGSFKARGGSFMWLRDALPKDLPGARIIVYGTDTTLQEGNSFQNLSHLGHGLRSTLNEVRVNLFRKLSVMRELVKANTVLIIIGSVR